MVSLLAATWQSSGTLVPGRARLRCCAVPRALEVGVSRSEPLANVIQFVPRRTEAVPPELAKLGIGPDQVENLSPPQLVEAIVRARELERSTEEANRKRAQDERAVGAAEEANAIALAAVAEAARSNVFYRVRTYVMAIAIVAAALLARDGALTSDSGAGSERSAALPSVVSRELRPGESLRVGEAIESEGGFNRLELRSTGEMAVVGPFSEKEIWMVRGFRGEPLTFVEFDSNCNLIGYSGRQLVLFTGNRAVKNCALTVRNPGGNVVIAGDGGAVWSSRRGVVD